MIEDISFINNYKRIERILKYAIETDYYKSLFFKNNINIDDIKSYKSFSQIPYLTKKTYRENTFSTMRKNIIDKLDLKKYHDNINMTEQDDLLKKSGLTLKITSGSTAKPLEVLKSVEDNTREYLSLNFYRRKMHNICTFDSFIWVWPISSYILEKFNFNEQKPFLRVNNYGYKYFISSYKESDFFSLYKFIKEKNIKWITSSASMLAFFSNYLINNNLSLKFNYIESHSEPLYDWQKRTIQKGLGSIPTNVYGSNEIQFIGMTCKNNNMHILENNVFVEIIKNKYGYKEIYATSLNCFDTIFIRYKIGDCAEWALNQECNCNSNYIIKLSQFRNNDLAISKDNSRYEPHLITASIYVLVNETKSEIENYKIVQLDYDIFNYYFDKELLKNEYIVDRYKKILREYLSKLFGYKIQVNILYIDREKQLRYTGKFKYFEIADSFRKSLD